MLEGKNRLKKVFLARKLRLFFCGLFFIFALFFSSGYLWAGNDDSSGFALSAISENQVLSGNDQKLELKIKKERNFLFAAGAYLRGFFYDEFGKAEIKAEIQGEAKDDFTAEIIYEKNGKFSVDIKPKSASIKPGRREIMVTLKDQELTEGETISMTQDFNWGVLAFNANKSIYAPGEEAYLQMGVLDNLGHTICDAELELEIIRPDKGRALLSSKNGLIIRNPECGPDNVISSPDYYAHYGLAGTGEYSIKITAVTKNGTWITTDKITVAENTPFSVERIGPTRINPTTDYGMLVRVKAREDFSGKIIDYMPKNFEITAGEVQLSRDKKEIGNWKLEIGNSEDFKTVSINDIDLKSGDVVEFFYMFDAPDVFPEFYLLGPLSFIGTKFPAGNLVPEVLEFSETRRWQIASDGENQVIVSEQIPIDAGTADTVNWTEAAKATSTLFTGGQKYFVYVTAGFSGSAAGVSADYEILYGSTIQYSGLIEASGDQANDAMQISWFDVMDQPATPDDIILQYRTNSGTSYIMNAQIMAINISNLETTDWKYAVNSTSRSLTTTATADASLTLNSADGVKDWLVFAMAEIDITSAARQYVSHIYNGSAAYMQQTREGENTSELLPHVLYRPFDNVAANTVFSIRNNSILLSANTHLRSRVFALNLNRFESFKTYYADIATGINGTWTGIGNLNSGGNYAPQTTGDQLIFASFINDITAYTNESDDRLQVNGATVPAVWSWGQSPANYRTGYDNAEELAHNIVAKASIPLTGQTIALDAIEVPNSTQVGDEVSMAVFSTRLKNINRPFGVLNSKAFRTDGSGVVDIAFDVFDRDLDDARIKVEYEAGSSCAFSSAAKAAISTVDADTTATYGDPKIDNTNVYQVGTTTGWVMTTFGTSTVEFNWLSQSDIPYASSTYCLRLTANDSVNDQLSSATTTVYIDNFNPVISSVVIPDRMYKIGDTLTATITLASAETDDLTVSGGSNINGGVLSNLDKISNTVFTVDYMVVSGQTDRASGTIPYEIALVDPYQNQSATSSASLANGSIDANAPEIAAIEIADLMYGVGDVLTATITISADASLYSLEPSSLNSATGTTNNLQKINNTAYVLQYAVAEGDTDRATGSIPYHVVLRDSYGNVNSPFTGNFAAGSVDAHVPQIVSVYIGNGNYKIGDNIEIAVNVNKAAPGYSDFADYILGNTTVNGVVITPDKFSYESGSENYKIIYTVSEGDTDRLSGQIPLSIVLVDKYGNLNAAYETPAANTASVDAHKPEILSVSLPDLAYKIGDTVRATATVSADTNAYSLGTTTINNVAVSNLQKINNSTYTFDYLVVSGNTDRPAGTIPVSLMLKDQLEQYNNPAFTAVSVNTAAIDANAPAISLVSFVPASGMLKIGDIATATITAAGNESGLVLGSVFNINGKDVKSTFTEIGAGTYRAVYAVVEGDAYHPADDDLPVNFVLTDPFGNESAAYVAPDPDNRPGVDAVRPVISNVIFVPSVGVLKIGDTATATISTDAAGYLAETIMINGIDVSGTFAFAGGNDYTVAYTVLEGQDNILDADDLPVLIIIKDSVGNNSLEYSAADAANRPGVNADRPAIAGAAFSPSSGLLKIGDTATATITALDLETGLLPSAIMTINGVDVSGSFAEIGGGLYRVAYTVAEGDDDISDENGLPVSLSLQDSAGNISTAYASSDAANRPGADAHRPLISDVVFSPSSGMLKIGDTATATIETDGSAYSAVAITINGKNVAGTLLPAVGNNYTVSYTVVESDSDINEIADLPVHIILSDPAGNNSIAYDAGDPAGRPGVDAHAPAISSVVFEPLSGLLKVGDTATATIAAASAETGLAGGATMTINGVDVSGSFAEIGGGQYRVVYTVVEGNYDIQDSADLPVALALRDYAGNVSAAFNAADAGNRPGVDANTPVISNVVFNITSGLLKIGDTATATIYADGPVYGAGAITINGIDVSSVLASAGGNNYTVSYTVFEGHNDISDGNDLPVSIALVDAAGNVSASYTAADSGNRPGADGHAPTAPGNLQFFSHSNDNITLMFGATTTEANFAEYKIYYKIGDSDVNEDDNVWDADDDVNLGNILFGGAASTTISGLDPGVDYVFNIWAYDQAGNKANAAVETNASTNKRVSYPDGLSQQKLGGSEIENGTWSDEEIIKLAATSTDPEGERPIMYFELVPASSAFSSATSVPTEACFSGASYGECQSKTWTSASRAGWHDSNWLYRKQIIIDSRLVEADLEDFPILATTTDADLAAYARADGFDIFFTASDGMTELPYEREYWSSGSGELVAWVKSDVSAATDTVIYLYYGNASQATDKAVAAGVWDSGFQGVWHLDESPANGGTYYDSTAYARNGTLVDADSDSITAAAGQIDGADNFTGDSTSDDYINVSSMAGLNGSYQAMVSYWAKQDTNTLSDYAVWGNNNILVEHGASYGLPTGADHIRVRWNLATLTWGDTHTIPNVLDADAWHYWVFAYDNGTTTVFKDGEPIYSKHESSAYTQLNTSATSYQFASRPATGSFDGSLDEIRIENSDRGAAWIRTTYDSQKGIDAFVRWQAQETEDMDNGSVTIVDLPDSAFGYKWQALACDGHGACSEWAVFDASAPNLKIDHTRPARPGSLSFAAKNTTSITFNFGSASFDNNFAEYKIFYKAAPSGVTENDYEFSSENDSNLEYAGYDNAATTTINSLSAGIQYVFNIWAYDQAGNSVKAGEIATTTLSASNPPTGQFNSAAQNNDGSGQVRLSLEIDDPDNDDTVRARLDYVVGTTCDFSMPEDPTISESGVSADNLPVPIIENSQTYQIGSSLGWIITSPGANTVDIDWLSDADLPDADGDYCLRLATFDGTFAQSEPATTTVYIDNKNPSAPGVLSLAEKYTNSLVLNFGATSTETNFREYRIYYKIADGTAPDESDSFLSSSTDDNLGDILFDGAASTSLSDLLAGTEYSIAIWSFDDYGNSASSTYVNLTTNYPAQAAGSLGQYESDGVSVIANGVWATENVVRLSASAGDNDNPETIRLYFELLPANDAFTTATSAPFGACSLSASWNECPSKIWLATSTSGDYSASPFIAQIAVSSLASSSAGYKWQTLACDEKSACASDWIKFDPAAPNFKVDFTSPTAPGNLVETSYTSTSTTLKFGTPSVEENFYQYVIYYKEGTSGVAESDTAFGSSTDANFLELDYAKASGTMITGLVPGTDYVFNIWAYDLAGNKSLAEEITVKTNNPPVLNIDSLSLKNDGSGAVDIVFAANDVDFENLSVKTEYASGASCDFISSFDPALDETDENATSTQDDAKIENDNIYQIGDSSGWIITSEGVNTVSLDWLSKIDLPDLEGDYCLRFTPYDGHEEGAAVADAVYIDNKAPSVPGSLVLAESHGDSLVLAFGATSSETNWSRYRLFHKQGVASVSESDSEQLDPDLNDILFNQTATTAVASLSANTQYSFRLFAFDSFGNKSQSGQTTFTTNSFPVAAVASAVQKTDGSGRVDIALEIYDTNGDPCYAKLEFATGTSCVFAPAGDPVLDEDAANVFADYGLPGIENDSDYQIGTSGIGIITAQGSNTIGLDWLSKDNLPAAEGDYCLRLTVSDGADTQSATATVYLDNAAPSAPSDLFVDYAGVRSVRLDFGTPGSDANFKEYKIFYKEALSGVAESDQAWTMNDDANLGLEDFGAAASTTIGGLIPDEDYVFNIWIYDDYGNKNQANEIATATLEAPGATWREDEDQPDPTAGIYAGKEQTVRLRVAVANSGTWKTEDYNYDLQYGVKNGTCADVLAWTPVPATPASEHFEMKSSIYFIENAPTTAHLSANGHTFRPGYMVQKPQSQSGTIVLFGNEYSELEFTIAATDYANRAATYCFRAANQGAGIDDYGVYPEFSLTPPPLSDFVSAAQRNDAGGRVDIAFTADDYSNQNLHAKLEYATGTTCIFDAAGKATIDSLNENTTAVYGDPLIDNFAAYQIGTSLGYIQTQYGENTVNADWLSQSDLAGQEGEYCLRLTVNDFFDDQIVPATTSLMIDNKAPSVPGDISLNSKTMDSVIINFGASATDLNFKEYRVYYKEGASGVTESDSFHDLSVDPHLGLADFGGAATTTISGLTANRQYVFRIYAYDDYGNKSAATGEFTTKLVPSISGFVYDADGITPLLTAPNITMVVNGIIEETVQAGVTDGRFIFREINPPAAGTPMLAYINGNAAKGAVYSLYGGAGEVNDFHIYTDRVVLRHYGAEALTNADIDIYDNDQDADLMIRVSGIAFSVLGAAELFIWPGSTFENSAEALSFRDVKIEGIFEASSTEEILVSGSWDAGGGQFDSASSTVKFVSANQDNLITTNNQKFHNLIFDGAGSWILADGATTTATTSIIQGELIQSDDFDFETGSLLIESGAVFTKSAGTGRLIFEDLGEGTFEDKNEIKNDLGDVIIGHSPAVTKMGSDMTADSLTVNSGDSLFTRGYELNITSYITINGTLDAIDDKEGDGTIITLGTNWTVAPTASFVAGNSTTTFSGAAASYISSGGTDASHDFYNLSFAKTSATSSVLSGYDIKIAGDLTIGSDSIFDVSSLNYAVNAGGNWINNGIFNARAGTTTFDAIAAGKTINPGASPFYRIVFDSVSGGWLIADNATSSQNWEILSASSFNVAADKQIEVKGAYVIGDTIPLVTAWNTGATLFLNSGTAYTIATKSQSGETYANLQIGANTDIRMWNSGAGAVSVDSSGSLYAMDYDSSDGALRIWGDYNRDSGMDFWNYASDFDGADISGAPRICQVQIAAGSDVDYSYAGLEIIGQDNATTTIANQGSGEYSLAIASTSLTMDYFQVRNADVDGIILSGTTTLSSISNGDMELSVDNGVLFSVSAATIDSSPWSTSTGIRFATSSDISGYNVELIGTPTFPWTFIAHSGNLAGEAHDSDSGDPRGYLLWDDSPSYSPKSQNWRWYHDEDKETPLAPATLENYAPQIIGDGNLLKLRITIKETAGVSAENIKMRLQYSTDSEFSADNNWVGESGSTTALWNYGDGIDNDNDPLLTRVLSDSQITATHNESGVSLSTFDQNAGSAAEWEFTLYANSPANNSTYYFRAISEYFYVYATYAAVAEKNNGSYYPSVIVSDAKLSFEISGLPENTVTEGVTTDINTSAISVPFGILPINSQLEGAQRFVITTNAENGYQLFAFQRQNMISNTGADIGGVPHTNDNPGAWPAAPDPGAFGYHAGDDTLSGASPSRFSPDNTFAGFETFLKEIAYSPMPVVDDSVDFVYRVQVNDLQSAGDYQTAIVYVLVPNF